MPYCNNCGEKIVFGTYCKKCNFQKAYKHERNSIELSTRIKPTIYRWLKNKEHMNVCKYMRELLEKEFEKEMKENFGT
jgi:hypothetical protein